MDKVKYTLGNEMTGEEYIDKIMDKVFIEKQIVIPRIGLVNNELQPFMRHHLKRCSNEYLNDLIIHMNIRLQDIVVNTALKNVPIEEVQNMTAAQLENCYSELDFLEYVETKTMEYQVGIFTDEVYKILNGVRKQYA